MQMHWKSAGSTEGAEPDEIWFDDNGITSNDISLVKDDVLRVTVEAYSSVSYRLLLQKAAKDTDKTALPWKGEIQQGEVKYFKFTKPAEDKADYLVSIPYHMYQISSSIHCMMTRKVV